MQNNNFVENVLRRWIVTSDEYVPKGSVIELREYAGEKDAVIPLDSQHVLDSVVIVKPKDEYLVTIATIDGEEVRTVELMTDDDFATLNKLEQAGQLREIDF